MTEVDTSLEAMAQSLIEELDSAEHLARGLMSHADLAPASTRDRLDRVLGSESPIPAAPTYAPDAIGEIKANIMLSVRHIEDARARLERLLEHARSGRL